MNTIAFKFRQPLYVQSHCLANISEFVDKLQVCGDGLVRASVCALLAQAACGKKDHIQGGQLPCNKLAEDLAQLAWEFGLKDAL